MESKKYFSTCPLLQQAGSSVLGLWDNVLAGAAVISRKRPRIRIACGLHAGGFLLFALLFTPLLSAAEPFRIAIAGLVHGHVSGFLKSAKARQDVVIAGIFDPDPALVGRYGDQFGVPANGRFTSLDAMLTAIRPDAVATFTSTLGHRAVVEASAKRKIPIMMEKPLATNLVDARAMAAAAKLAGVPVIVNYETTWYPSHAEIWRIVRQNNSVGDIRRMVAMDGHQGPKEIHVQPEFFDWLTDPEQNGAGALFDFGCYGANLMTWLMDGERPLKVTAIIQTNKPKIYEDVDDEATVLLEYAKAQGVIEASWNWPFARKDLEVYGESGYAIATGGTGLRVRFKDQKAEEVRTPAPLAPNTRDPISYLMAIVRNKVAPSGLSSMENNLVVVEILEAARESARSGKTVVLAR